MQMVQEIKMNKLLRAGWPAYKILRPGKFLSQAIAEHF